MNLHTVARLVAVAPQYCVPQGPMDSPRRSIGRLGPWRVWLCGWVCLAWPSTFTCSTFGKLPFCCVEVRSVGIVSVLFDLSAYVLDQVFSAFASKPLADATVSRPHVARHADVDGRRVVCRHEFTFRVPTRILRPNLLCGYTVIRYCVHTRF